MALKLPATVFEFLRNVHDSFLQRVISPLPAASSALYRSCRKLSQQPMWPIRQVRVGEGDLSSSGRLPALVTIRKTTVWLVSHMVLQLSSIPTVSLKSCAIILDCPFLSIIGFGSQCSTIRQAHTWRLGPRADKVLPSRSCS